MRLVKGRVPGDADPHARGGADHALANIPTEGLADQDICRCPKTGATVKTT